MKYRLLITDIGGVLIKTDEAIIQCIEKVFKENGIPVGSKQKLFSVFGVSIFDYIKNYLPDGYDDKADICFEEFQKLYPSSVLNIMSVFPGVNEALSDVRSHGSSLAVLSCMNRHEVDANLSLLTFNNFDTIFSLEDCGGKRPNPEGINRIRKYLKIQAEETIYIGDTVMDIEMAKNAGVTSVAVRTGALPDSALENAHPDYLIDTFAQILEILD